MMVVMCGARLLPLLLFPFLFSAIAQKDLYEVKVGVVLDLVSTAGKMSSSCISMSLQDFYANHSDYKTRLTLDVRDSKGDVFLAASEAFNLINNTEVKAIIGPQTSEEAFFVAYLGNTFQVPIVSFSATSPSLSTARTTYLLRTTQTDSSSVKAIAAIVKAYGWKNVVTIHEDSNYGDGIIPDLIDALDEIHVRVPFRSIIPSDASDDLILKELYKLMTMQTRVFLVHMTTDLGSRFFKQAWEAEMMSQESVWIITDGLIDLFHSKDPLVVNSMQGVLGVKPYVPMTKARDEFLVSFKKKVDDPEKAERDIFMLRAYDSLTALAMAIENVDDFTNGNSNFKQLASYGPLRISPDGPKLLGAISALGFTGLGGTFRLVDGQLELPGFEIVNLVGNETKCAGFWTPGTSNLSLESVTWPGNYYTVPKGWVIPTNAKRLRIGVPVKEGYEEFIKVELDAETNRTIVSGYSRDVFDLVIESLPYAVLYEFVNVTGGAAEAYNGLVSDVFKGKYDAAVGDISITAKRSEQVDFTLPYMDSGIALLVPVRDDKSKNAWVFLKPFTLDLWLTTWAFFVITGMVVWCLEHRINGEFGGSPAEQIGVTFYFSFSTMLFAHREAVVGSLTRMVVIVWVFAVLIISSSYQGSFTSMLTVPKLRPIFADINFVRNSGKPVGFQHGSFVDGFLVEKLNFTKDRLVGLVSREDYAQALSNGTVVAIIDEVPYIRLFLAKYCSNYTMIGPICRTGGLSFAFAKGSPLVPDFSNAILKVIDKISRTDQAWFPRQTTSCPDLGSAFGSDALSPRSFLGLFIITGVASLLAVIIFLASMLYKRNRISRTTFEERSSLWLTIIKTARLLHQTNQQSPSGNSRPASRESITSTAIEDGTDSPIAGESPSSIELVTQGRSRSIKDDETNVRRGSRLVKSLSFPFTARSNTHQYEKND